MNRAISRRGTFALAGLLALCVSTTAQPAADAGVAALGLAGATTARDGARFVRWNPAAATPTDRIVLASARVGSGGLAGLHEGDIVASHAVDSGIAVAAALTSLAFRAYRLVTLQICARTAVTPDLAAGASLRYDAQSIDRYGTSDALELDVGVRIAVGERIAAGVVARNVGRARQRGIPRAQFLAAGVVARLDDVFDLSLDVAHETGRGPALSVGGELAAAAAIRLRGGIDLAAPSLCFGIGYDDGVVVVDIAGGSIGAAGLRFAAAAGLRW